MREENIFDGVRIMHKFVFLGLLGLNMLAFIMLIR